MFILGVDIGTTSVKVALSKNGNLVSSRSKRTEADIAMTDHPEFYEQDPKKIVICLIHCIEDLEKDVGTETMSEISDIVVCGQMHGCVLWDSHEINLKSKLKVSTLITWRDCRCDENFIESLPWPNNSTTPLSTGFGCATLLWLNKFNEAYMHCYNCCGTIADYVVSLLANLPKPIMSTQVANSWGYFNVQMGEWDMQIMEAAEFPTERLPRVVVPQTVVGTLAQSIGGISEKANVFVALGDMQCSVLSCEVVENEAVLNLSTSCQLSMLVPRFKTTAQQNDTGKKLSPVTRVPYFGKYDLLTAASLNGGAVFREYVRMLTNWTNKFSRDVSEEEVREILTRSGEDIPTTSTAFCIPCTFGERHDPTLRASFNNIGPQDLNVTWLGLLVARGVLSNVRQMFDSGAPGMLGNVDRVWGCGGAFSSNPLFRQELRSSVFGDTVVSFDRTADAAYGATLAVTTTF